MIGPSEKTKRKRHRGTGEGADYIPWIRTREVKGNTGTSTILVDWKHHRQVHLLSQGEVWAYCILRWRDDVLDIREQFPLDLAETRSIAKSLGYLPPQSTMTTDLLVTFVDGRNTYLKAYSVKGSEDDLTKDRCVELRMIEKLFWERQGVGYQIVFKNRLNRNLVMNIRNVCRYYDLRDCQTTLHVVSHCIARKYIKTDMRSNLLDIGAVAKEWLDDDAKKQYLVGRINEEMDREQVDDKYRLNL